MYREINSMCALEEGRQPFSILFTLPAGYCAVVHRFRFIGYNLVGINSEYPSVPFTRRACAIGVVVIEELWRRFREDDTIEFEPVIKYNRGRRFTTIAT